MKTLEKRNAKLARLEAARKKIIARNQAKHVMSPERDEHGRWLPLEKKS